MEKEYKKNLIEHREIVKFIVMGILYCILFILILEIYFLICLNFSYTPNITTYFNEVFEIKDRIALEKQSPKIIIVSGSNSWYSISAKEMENNLNIPGVNYAFSLDFYDYMFYRVKKVANPGDIILIPLEYEYYWHEDKTFLGRQGTKHRYIVNHDSEYFNNLTLFQKFNYNILRGEDIYLNIISQKYSPNLLFDPDTINEWGDETNNLVENKKEFYAEPIKFPEEFVDTFPNYDGVREISRFSKWCNENDITLIATFPSTVYFSEYESSEYQERFNLIKKFYNNLNVTIIGEPEDSFYNIESFYNSIYHLNNNSMYDRTMYFVDEFAKLKGIKILSLPTGQGLILK